MSSGCSDSDSDDSYVRQRKRLRKAKIFVGKFLTVYVQRLRLRRLREIISNHGGPQEHYQYEIHVVDTLSIE